MNHYTLKQTSEPGDDVNICPIGMGLGAIPGVGKMLTLGRLWIELADTICAEDMEERLAIALSLATGS